MRVTLILVLAVLAFGFGGSTLAEASVLVFDEQGNGAFGSGVLKADPGPGGLPAVLTYALPFAGVQGDVFLTDADFGNVRLDVIRFNGDGTLVFYSDNVDGFDALADTPGPPGLTYQNLVSIPELGTEQDNGALYAPGPGQPGYDPNALPTYLLISDGTFGRGVPEPSVLLLLGSGFAGAAGLNWRRARGK